MTPRNVEPLDDASLDREIREALSVQPSPELLARIRQRIADEAAPRGWHFSSWLAGTTATGLAAVLVLTIIMWNQSGSTPGAPNRFVNGAARDVDLVPAPAPAVVAIPPSPPITPQVVVDTARHNSAGPEPEVLVSQSEADLIWRLVRQVREGYVEPGKVVGAPSAATPLDRPSEITIPPVVVEPLTPTGN